MKATLEFNLPEESNEYLLTQKGASYYCALFDIQQEMFRLKEEGVRCFNIDDFNDILDRNFIDLEEVE